MIFSGPVQPPARPAVAHRSAGAGRRRDDLLRGQIANGAVAVKDSAVQAWRRQACVAEGDGGMPLRPAAHHALHLIDSQGCVIDVGPFFKALSPRLRLGYLMLPPELVPVFGQARRLSERHAPVLEPARRPG